MKILITGIAGFVGSQLAKLISKGIEGVRIVGIDNLSRRGSETNLLLLNKLGCEFIHGDIRNIDDVTELPKVDWIVDCAANPSVLAGLKSGSSQLVGHNLIGTLNLLEKCRREQCGFLMISSSRVYSIGALRSLPLKEDYRRFSVDNSQPLPTGFTLKGIGENFLTSSPISLYGATKLASELMVLEYSSAFQFPVWINRCGVIAGAGQFGKIDQGIFSFWIYQWMLGKPLSYIGFGGDGKQVRDLLCPQDLATLVLRQLKHPDKQAPKIINVGGGLAGSMSLKELSDYCFERLGRAKKIDCVPETRPFDIPYYVTDNSLADKIWQWQPTVKIMDTLDTIADWAITNKSMIESGFLAHI